MKMVEKEQSIGIVGRGLAGLSLARVLSLKGYKDITIYGPVSAPGSASRAAVGVVTLKGWNEPRHPLFLAKYLGHKSLPTWLSSLAADVRLPIRQNWGLIYEPFRDGEEYKWIRERVYHRDFHGGLAVSVVSAPPLPRAWKACGAFHYWQDGWVHPGDLCDALESSLTRYRTRSIEERVVTVESGEAGGIRVMGNDGILGEHDEVVLAAGIFTSDILEASGVTFPRMQPVSGWTMVNNQPSMTQFAGIFGKMACVQSLDELRFGSTSNQQGIHLETTGYSDRNQSSQTSYLSDYMESLGYSLATSDPLFGVRARTKDRQPLVGSVEFGCNTRLWLLTGLYKNGLQLSHFLADLLVDAWSFGEFSDLLKFFFPRRSSDMSNK